MRIKGALVLLAILVAIAGVSFFVYRLAKGSPRKTAHAGLTDPETLVFTHPAAPAGVADARTLVSTQVAPMQSFARPAVPRMNPYAVVRGGICVSSNVPHQEKASREKWEALLRDPSWQSIFSGVNPEEFSLVRTSMPLDRYVAYWKMANGQLIHWTGKEIRIPAGTRVFTDSRGICISARAATKSRRSCRQPCSRQSWRPNKNRLWHILFRPSRNHSP